MTDGRYQLPLYVTEAQIVQRMGVGINAGRKAVQKMRLHPKFPPRTIGAKRYWPAVVDFLDYWNGRSVGSSESYAEPDHAETQPARRLRRQTVTPPTRLGPDAPEAERRRYGYADEKGNFRKIVAGLRSGTVRVTGPDGRKWIEDVNDADPNGWRRQRSFKPWPENDPRRKLKPTPPTKSTEP